MVDVRIINDKDEWNDKLLKTLNYNVFSSYEWGSYKSNSWEVKRLAFYKSGNFLGQCQFLIKKKYKIIIAWNSGGINLVHYKNLELIVQTIRDYFKDYTFTFRFNFYDLNNAEKSFKIKTILKPSQKSINSGFSLIHNLKSENNFLKDMSSNHRYYYKKAIKNDFTITYGHKNLINDFILLHNEMTSSKELENLKIHKNDIVNLSKNFKDNFLIVSVNLNNEIIASCLILIFEDQAFYYLAASNALGRKTYASYFMVKELLEYLCKHDIKQFDFAGITPYDNNAIGVNKFKIGFGGDMVNYLGEWEMSNSKLLSFFINRVYL